STCRGMASNCRRVRLVGGLAPCASRLRRETMREVSGSPNGTSAGNVFLESIAHIRSRLAQDPSPAALILDREATELQESFRHWAVERPANDVRLKTIQRLMTLRERFALYDGARSTHRG